MKLFRSTEIASRNRRPLVLSFLAICFSLLLFFLFSAPPSEHDRPNNVLERLTRVRKALPLHLTTGIDDSLGRLPVRLRRLKERGEAVGENLWLVKSGIETMEEILHGTKSAETARDKPPLTIDEITSYLTGFLLQYHEICSRIKKATHEDIWTAYHDLTLRTLYPWVRWIS